MDDYRHRAMNSNPNPKLGVAIDGDVQTVIDDVRLAARLGFDYVEWNAGNPRFSQEYWTTQVSTLRNTLSEHDIELCVHLPQIDILIGSPRDPLKEASVDVLKQYISLSAELGAFRVSLHPLFSDNDLPKRHEEAKTNLVDSVERLHRCAREHDVQLVAENGIPDRQRKHQVPLQRFHELFGDGDVPYALNVGHAFVTGLTSAEIGSYLRRHGDRIFHIYMNDTTGRCDKHLLLGDGNVTFDTILRAVHEDGWSGSITVEVHSNDIEHLSHSKRVVERHLASATHQ